MVLPLFPGEPRPLLFAHRGLSARAPENSLRAFGLAAAAGITGVELDVHLAGDGKLAVIHDHFTGRTIPESRSGDRPEGYEIERTGWPILAALTIPDPGRQDPAPLRIPTLDEVFEALGTRVLYDIELKNRIAGDYGLEAAVARTVAESGLEERIAVSSFNPFSIARFKKLCPAIPAGIIWSRSKELHPLLRHGGGCLPGKADFLKPEWPLVGGAMLAFWRCMGRECVIPWTIDDAGHAKAALRAGCTGIVSNRPDELGIAVALRRR